MALPIAVGAAIGQAIRYLVGQLLSWIGPMIVSALLYFGLTFVSSEYAIAPLLSAIQAQLSGLPAVGLDVLGFVKADVAISMILSAYITRAATQISLRRKPQAQAPAP